MGRCCDAPLEWSVRSMVLSTPEFLVLECCQEGVRSIVLLTTQRLIQRGLVFANLVLGGQISGAPTTP